MDDDGSSHWWLRLHDWANVIHAEFSNGYISLSTKHLALTFLYGWNNVKSYYYAKFQADPGMFSYQNRQGLNQPILRPLWLMTAAAADVISIPSVKPEQNIQKQKFFYKFVKWCHVEHFNSEL